MWSVRCTCPCEWAVTHYCQNCCFKELITSFNSDLFLKSCFSSFLSSSRDWATLVRWSVSQFHSSTQQVGHISSEINVITIPNENQHLEWVYHDLMVWRVCAAFLMEQLHVALRPVVKVPLLLTRNEVKTHLFLYSVVLQKMTNQRWQMIHLRSLLI